MTKNGQQQIDYALATLAVEGDIPSEYAVQLCEQVANGSLTADEAVSETRGILRKVCAGRAYCVVRQ